MKLSTNAISTTFRKKVQKELEEATIRVRGKN